MHLIDDDEDDKLQLTVNSEYARRLQHNKQREELDRLQQKYAHAAIHRQELAKEDEGAEAESASSSSSEEDIDILDELHDPDFLLTLAQLRQGSATDGDVKLNIKEPPKQSSRQKRPREGPVYLKDVMQLTAGVEEGEGEGTSEGTGRLSDSPKRKTQAQELEGLRKSLIEAAADGTSSMDRADLFNRRHEAPPDGQQLTGSNSAKHIQQRLDQLFGRDEDLSHDDLFLKKFLVNKGEAKHSDSPGSTDSLEAGDLEEDEEFLEAADKFEAKHNFRFEEQGATKVKTYPRQVGGTIRQEDTGRADARARKKSRKQMERAQMESEMQRLKTLKRQEIEERMEEIRALAGLPDVTQQLQEYLMSDTFDAQSYDAAMQNAFSEEYYQEADPDMKYSEDADDFEEEGQDHEGTEQHITSGTFKAMRNLQARMTPGKSDTQTVQQLLREYNQLEFEDIVAGLPTKFHYKQVDIVDDGLTTDDILSLSDKDLNQVVGLKKYAPYREERDTRRLKHSAKHKLMALRKHQQVERPEKMRSTAELSSQKPEERRKSTYVLPQLNASVDLRDQRLPSTNPNVSPASLTKAQKRNIRRTKKRKDTDIA